jgi:hypothetical protein
MINVESNEDMGQTVSSPKRTFGTQCDNKSKDMRSGPNSSTKMTMMSPRLGSAVKDGDVNSDIEDLIPADR